MSRTTIGRSLDWSLVSALRAQASEQLSQAVAADRGRLDKTAQEELGRTIVLDLIETTVADRVNAGMTALPGSEQDALARAVFDSLFRLGRLQPLVDDDRVENIIITGHDNVLLELTDGSLVDGPPVADSDERADRLPGLPRLAFRGQCSRVLRSPAAAAPAPGRRLAPGRRRVGDPAPVRGDPPSPADGGHPRRPRRPADAHPGRGVVPAGGGAGLARASSSRAARARARRRWSGRCAPRSTRWRRSAPSRPSTSCTCTSCATGTGSSIPWEARPGLRRARSRRSRGRGVHPRRGAGRLLPLQPLPPDRRRGPRQGDLGDDQGDGVRHRLHLHHPRLRRRRRDPQAGHLRDGGRAARHPRARDEQAGLDHRRDRPPRPADAERGRALDPSAPGGRDHRHRPRRARDGLRDHPCLRAGPRRHRCAGRASRRLPRPRARSVSTSTGYLAQQEVRS